MDTIDAGGVGGCHFKGDLHVTPTTLSALIIMKGKEKSSKIIILIVIILPHSLV